MAEGRLFAGLGEVLDKVKDPPDLLLLLGLGMFGWGVAKGPFSIGNPLMSWGLICLTGGMGIRLLSNTAQLVTDGYRTVRTVRRWNAVGGAVLILACIILVVHEFAHQRHLSPTAPPRSASSAPHPPTHGQQQGASAAPPPASTGRAGLKKAAKLRPSTAQSPRSLKPPAKQPAAESPAIRSGEHNQQTVNQAPVVQANSGGCNQQVVGGNGNVTNCVPPIRHLSVGQQSGIIPLIAGMPPGCHIQVESADDGEAESYAQEIVNVISQRTKTSGLIEGIAYHPKGLWVLAHSTTDPCAQYGLVFDAGLKNLGLPIAGATTDPHIAPNTVMLVVGQQ